MPTLVQKRFNPAGTVGVSGVDFVSFTDIKNYLAPLDLVASDLSIQILMNGTLTWPTNSALSIVNADDLHRVTLMPDAGSNVNALERTTLTQGSSGAAIAMSRSNTYAGGLSAGIDINDMRFLVTGAAGGTTPIFLLQNKKTAMTIDNMFSRCRFYDTSLGVTTNTDTAVIRTGVSNNRTSFRDCLIVMDSAGSKAFVGDAAGVEAFRNTFVALGAAKGAVTAIKDSYGAFVRNNIFIDFSELYSTQTATANRGNNFVNVAPTTGNLNGYTVVAGAGALVVSETTDFRPKAGSLAIGGGSTAAVGKLDILSNNRGNTPDAGAWQLTPAIPLPGGTITTKTVNGTTVTLSGTTTGSPTSAKASLTPTTVAYNGAVAQTNVDVTLGTGTFTVTFTNVKTGEYLPTVTLTNAGGAASATNSGNVSIISATGTVTAQALDGQSLTLSGTTSGNPTSGAVYVPAAATNPNGAYTYGPIALLITTGAFSMPATDIPTGNYDKPVVLLTNADGTSFPLGGTALAAISVIGISGDPEAPPPTGTAPTVTSVTVSPSTATGSTTFSATVNGTNSPSQAVTWSASAGTITSAGVFTAPAATTSVQNITVTAVSVADTSKVATATVTIAASANAPTVTSVSISPTSASVAGNATQQFTASVVGTNSPAQTVTWSATSGTLSASGLFTAPAATSSVQVITVTATSTVDTGKYASATITIGATQVTTPKTATICMYRNGVPAANLTGLKWAWHDQATPDLFAAPTNKGANGTTDAQGYLTVTLTNTALSVGGVGSLTVSNSTGDATAVHQGFVGPVVVA